MLSALKRKEKRAAKEKLSKMVSMYPLWAPWSAASHCSSASIAAQHHSAASACDTSHIDSLSASIKG